MFIVGIDIAKRSHEAIIIATEWSIRFIEPIHPTALV